MCNHCNYQKLLTEAGLEPTAHRLRVIETIGGSRAPLTADHVYRAVAGISPVNRVTVYRILDRLVRQRVVEKISGSRAAHYGLAPNEHHAPHPHFCCTRCGTMVCLNPESLVIDLDTLQKTTTGTIERVEVLVAGVCRTCRQDDARSH